MWAPFMAADYHHRRSHVIAENMTLREIEAMWNAHNQAQRGS